MEEPAILGLFETFGGRRSQHKAVLYLNLNKDWSARQLERNGNHCLCKAAAVMTDEATRWLKEESPHRAMSLQYTGVGRQGIEGLAADLRDFGYDEAVIKKFTDAAAIMFGTSPIDGELFEPSPTEGKGAWKG